MKFLCVPCDTPMKLQTVVPPDRGSLSVVYSCPACGYEMAMLTNAYETQVVQSLGVRIGPASASAQSASARQAGAAPGVSTEGASGCPFPGMIQGRDEAQRGQAADVTPVRWTAGAEARL